MELKITGSNRGKTLYNYYSAKKIYLASTPSKLLLLEKKSKPILSLVSRNTVIINTKNGMLLFPTTK